MNTIFIHNMNASHGNHTSSCNFKVYETDGKSGRESRVKESSVGLLEPYKATFLVMFWSYFDHNLIWMSLGYPGISLVCSSTLILLYFPKYFVFFIENLVFPFLHKAILKRQHEQVIVLVKKRYVSHDIIL